MLGNVKNRQPVLHSHPGQGEPHAGIYRAIVYYTTGGGGGGGVITKIEEYLSTRPFIRLHHPI